MKPSETLREALDLLYSDGWCKYKAFSVTGEHCAIGVVCLKKRGIIDRPTLLELWPETITLNKVAEALFPDRKYTGPYTVINQHWARPFLPIAHINNHPDTTFEDVVQIFEKAILQLEEEGK